MRIPKRLHDPAVATGVIGTGGVFIAFRVTRYGKDLASELVERRVGQTASSHGGRHAYRRKELPDEIPHRRLIRGAVILRAEDGRRVVGLREKMRAKVYARTVEPMRQDKKALIGCVRSSICFESGSNHKRRESSPS